jgi:hypothetical protein
MGAKRDSLDDMGDLLWEEPRKATKSRRNMIRWLGIGFTIVAMIMAPLGILFSSFLFLFYTAILFTSGLFMILFRQAVAPIQIYENGILFAANILKFRFFISWGEMTKVTEQPLLTLIYYIFETQNKGKLRIQKDLAGLTEIIDSVKDRIGKDEYKFSVFSEEKLKNHKKMELWTYPLGFFIAVALSILVVSSYYNATFPPIIWVMAFGFGLPLLAIGTIGIILFMMADWRSKFLIKKRVSLPPFTAVVIIINIVFFVSFSTGMVVLYDDVHTTGNFRQSPPPSNYWDGGSSLNGGTFNLYQSLYVQNGETFTISDSLVVFGSDEDLGIYVERTGHLIIENSTISSHNPDVGYWFEVYGKLTVYDSVIKHVWGNPDYENKDGGIELYGAEATFEASNIEDCITNGILAKDSDLTIQTTVVERCGDDGVELHRTSANIDDTIFRYNGWPLMLWNESDARVSNCTFDSNEHGMWIIQSSPTVEYCIFQDTAEGPAISIADPDSEPVLTENDFSNNEAEVDRPSSPLLCCYIIALPMISIIFIILIWYKNTRITV